MTRTLNTIEASVTAAAQAVAYKRLRLPSGGVKLDRQKSMTAFYDGYVQAPPEEEYVGCPDGYQMMQRAAGIFACIIGRRKARGEDLTDSDFSHDSFAEHATSDEISALRALDLGNFPSDDNDAIVIASAHTAQERKAARLDHAWELALRIVYGNEAAIKSIASALRSRRVMSGDEVSAALSGGR